MVAFQLDVSYAQVAVFDSTLTAPFNDWKDEHVAQGFAWRPGSVSFGTMEGGGPISIEIFRSRVLDEASSAAGRIISVPFTVPEHRALEVASIGSSAAFELPAGEYELTFEHGHDPTQRMWANFYFRPVSTPVAARIIRADPELHPSTRLAMNADPA